MPAPEIDDEGMESPRRARPLRRLRCTRPDREPGAVAGIARALRRRTTLRGGIVTCETNAFTRRGAEREARRAANRLTCGKWNEYELDLSEVAS